MSITVANVTLKTDVGVVEVAGKAVRLGAVEAGIVHTLMTDPGQGYTGAALAERLGTTEGSIKVMIHRLRRKLLRLDPQFNAIQSQPGSPNPGYRWRVQ